jgi:SAM-dependent methyltransferase
MARWFPIWVRLMEADVRLRAVRDAPSAPQRALVIGPPTDPGLLGVARANRGGLTVLACLSAATAKLAQQCWGGRALPGLGLVVAAPDALPHGDGSFDVVHAPCFFDFLAKEELPGVVGELRRILRPGGALLAAYMAPPRRAAGGVWTALFRRLPRLTGGCRPVAMRRLLEQGGFQVLEDLHLPRWGFPLQYTRAVRLPEGGATR